MALSAEQKDQLSEALRDGYRSYDDLEILIAHGLGKRLNDLVRPARLPSVVFQLIEEAESEGWEVALIEAAYLRKRGNPKLALFHKRFFQNIAAVDDGENLEKIVKRANPAVDITLWRRLIERAEAQVCLIEINGDAVGTGFLVGPQLLLTNHHVLSKVISKEVMPARVELRFDYKRLAPGQQPLSSSVHKLAQDWLVAASPPSAIDLRPDPKPAQPDPMELDFALVRLHGRPGDEVVEGKPRGFIDLTGSSAMPQVGAPLIIVQHPRGEPLQLAIDTEGLRSVNSNGTRVRYTTNTRPGSSGSPCFTIDWKIAALHHSGDPNYVATYNEGIPITAILAYLTAKGLSGLLAATAAEPGKAPA